MSLEYLLDVAIQIEHPNFPQDYLEAEDGKVSPSSPTDSTDSDRRRPHATSDDDNMSVKVECTDNTSMLKPTFMYRKAEAARRRRLAIDRRNERRHIVPRSTVDDVASAGNIDRNKTKNRISAASYRENRDKRVSFILNELAQLQNEFPHLQSKPWTPVKKQKSAMREGETKDQYRKRTNRESAADSRFHQQQKLQHLTRELARLRQLAQYHRSQNSQDHI